MTTTIISNETTPGNRQLVRIQLEDGTVEFFEFPIDTTEDQMVRIAEEAYANRIAGEIAAGEG